MEVQTTILRLDTALSQFVFVYSTSSFIFRRDLKNPGPHYDAVGVGDQG